MNLTSSLRKLNTTWKLLPHRNLSLGETKIVLPNINPRYNGWFIKLESWELCEYKPKLFSFLCSIKFQLVPLIQWFYNLNLYECELRLLQWLYNLNLYECELRLLNNFVKTYRGGMRQAQPNILWYPTAQLSWNPNKIAASWLTMAQASWSSSPRMWRKDEWWRLLQ